MGESVTQLVTLACLAAVGVIPLGFCSRSCLETLYNTPACLGMEDDSDNPLQRSRAVPESSQEILEVTKVRGTHTQVQGEQQHQHHHQQ